MKIFPILFFVLLASTQIQARNEVLDAVYGGKKDVVAQLLASGADVNQAGDDYNGDTPLMAACMKGYEDIVALLLAKNAKVNVRNVHGDTALILAVVACPNSIETRFLPASAAKLKVQARIISMLLAAGANKTVVGLSEMTAADFAKVKEQDSIYNLVK